MAREVEDAVAGDVPELAARLRLSIARLNRQIRQQTAIEGEELTATSQGALATVARLGPMTLGELAAVERVRPPTVTPMVSRLEELGYVTRSADPGDRRVARVSITRSGIELLSRMRTRKDAFLAQRIAELTSEEQRLLARVLPVLEHLERDSTCWASSAEANPPE